MSQHRVARSAGYFGDEGRSLFGWYHERVGPATRDCVAVICPPFGHEYSSSHRTLRHLADALASHGIAALRFDYHGTGDSPATSLAPERMRRWQEDIAAAIAHARAVSGRSSICLVGLRMGATLAAIATSTAAVDLLVLWSPVVKGRAYVRELQAIAMTADRPPESIAGELESAGFVTSAETLDAFRRIDLSAQPVRSARRTLLVSRDDQSPDPAFVRHLQESGVAFEEMRASGWAAMMAEPHYTEVPAAALQSIVAWVERNSRTAGAVAPHGAALRESISISASESSSGAPVEEEICHFGEGGRLFGILSRGTQGVGDIAIVMPNAGAQHRVGPNRLYVILARELAPLGLPCLRFDISGLGDSVREGEENVTYPDWAVPDTVAAIEYLQRTHGFRRFIVMGLCSGAHTAFHVGVEDRDHELVRVVLINPLTYQWEEGTSLDVSTQFKAVQRYRKAVRDPRRWLKLLRGKVAMTSLIRTSVAHSARTLRSKLQSVGEVITPAVGSPLSRNLQSLAQMKRPLALVVSHGDPGLAMLMTGARRAANRGLRSGDIVLRHIEDADHTFSRQAARMRLIACLRDYVTREGLLSAAPHPER